MDCENHSFYNPAFSKETYRSNALRFAKPAIIPENPSHPPLDTTSDLTGAFCRPVEGLAVGRTRGKPAGNRDDLRKRYIPAFIRNGKIVRKTMIETHSPLPQPESPVESTKRIPVVRADGALLSAPPAALIIATCLEARGLQLVSWIFPRKKLDRNFR